MEFNEFLRKVQPESRALLLPGVVVAHLLECREDLFLVLFGDADPRVTDRNFQVLILQNSLYPDHAIFAGKLYGVRKKVKNDLLELSFIGRKKSDSFVYFKLELDGVAIRPLSDEI